MAPNVRANGRDRPERRPLFLQMNHPGEKLGAHCGTCPLKDGVFLPPVAVKPGRRLNLVTDPVSGSDINRGALLQGQSSKHARAILGSHADDANVFSSVLCHSDTANDKQRMKAAECCAPRLLRQLAQTEGPIVTFGKEATWQVLNVKNVLIARGFAWTVKKEKLAKRKAAKRVLQKGQNLKAETLLLRSRLTKRMVAPTLALQFAMRADTWSPLLRLDLKRVMRLFSGSPANAHIGPYRATKRVSDLYWLGDVVSLDIETDGVKPTECNLLCVGVSNGRESLVLWPWAARMAKRLSRFLRGRKQVVGHNVILFDAVVLAAHGVR